MKEKIKVGYIGCGGRGNWVIEGCLRHMKDVEIAMICDVRQNGLDKAKSLLTESGRPEPVMTMDYEEVINNPELDAVFIMTGWSNRAEMAAKSLRAGKYTAIEVGCAFDLSECYHLLDAYEETKVPLMMLENCCYSRREMMVLNVAKKGLFGEIIHCEGGYHHHLPEEDLLRDEDHNTIRGVEGEKTHYRIQSYIHRSCEQYPTHELGPIMKILGINRGNKMLTLSSFASKARAINEALKKIGTQPMTGFVSAEGLTSNPNLLHFNAASQREFGLRYYAEFLKLEDKNKVFEEKPDHGGFRSAIELL